MGGSLRDNHKNARHSPCVCVKMSEKKKENRKLREQNGKVVKCIWLEPQGNVSLTNLLTDMGLSDPPNEPLSVRLTDWVHREKLGG